MHIFDPREMVILDDEFNENFELIQAQLVGLIAFNTYTPMEE